MFKLWLFKGQLKHLGKEKIEISILNYLSALFFLYQLTIKTNTFQTLTVTIFIKADGLDFYHSLSGLKSNFVCLVLMHFCLPGKQFDSN